MGHEADAKRLFQCGDVVTFMSGTPRERDEYPEWMTVRIRGPLLQSLDAVVASDALLPSRSEALHTAVREFIERRQNPYAPPEIIQKAVDDYLARINEDAR